MSEDRSPAKPLSAGAERLCAAALFKVQRGQESCALHWILAAAETVPDVLGKTYTAATPADLRPRLRDAIHSGQLGPPLNKEDLVARASSIAAGSVVEVSDLVQAMLETARPLLDNLVGGRKAGGTPPATREEDAHGRDVPRPSAGSFGSALAEMLQHLQTSRGPAGASSQPTSHRRDRGTTLLDQLAVDLTAKAREGSLTPVVGRDEEIELVLETLCKVTKRNPALVGPAGVGKTAIAEGVAQRIASGECPDMLRNARIYLLHPAAILEGVSSPPEYAARVRQIIEEASDPDVILFIDEFHSVLERGTVMENDLVTLLKPALARGDLACIAATTDDEYRRIIESDSALERRFQAIRVREMDGAATLRVLEAHRKRLAAKRDVRVSDVVLKRIVNIAGDRMPNRHFPDKAVDVLEQVVAHAMMEHRKTVRQTDVVHVVERLTGAPADVAEVLADLEKALLSEHLLEHDDIAELIRQLRVASAGLDIRPERPNAIILMLGAAASGADALSAVIAEHFSGSPDRVVDIDFSPMTHPADITRLIGASPSYIGYGEELPIHALIQYPWSVLLCRNTDLCHSSIQTALINALRRGVIVDGMGRSIRLCDCVVVVTAGDTKAPRSGGPIGLVPREEHQIVEERIPTAVRPELREISTIVVEKPAAEVATSRRHIEEWLLPTLAAKYQERGLDVEWGAGIAEWVLNYFKHVTSSDELEEKAATRLGEYLMPYFPSSGRVRVKVIAVNGDLQIEKVSPRRNRL